MKQLLYKLIALLIPLVWLINGLYCKILNGVPRHQEIVSELLSVSYARELTLIIGFGEVFLALWILKGKLPKATCYVQISLVLLMNCIEQYFLVNQLLWGRWNMMFALLFAGLIYYDYRMKRANLKYNGKTS